MLLVDDNEGDLLLIRSMLREMPALPCAMDWAGSLQEAVATYRAIGAHDIYLLDYRLGKATGLDVRRELVALGCVAPMLILTGHGQPHIDSQSMRAGAADYIEKRDLSPTVLARSIQHALERSSLTRSLRASEERYRTLATSLPNSCVLLVDRGGCLLLADGACLTWLGRDAMPGMDVRVVFPRPFADDLARHVAEALSGTSSSFEAAVGDRRLLTSIARFPCRLEIEQALVVVQDVTELRRAQTLATANERMAEIGTLASGLAHEFNNLHGIIGCAVGQVLRREDLDAQMRAKLLLVHGATERAAGVTENLLSFARGSRGGFERVPLRDVILETLEIVMGGFESDGIAIEHQLSPAPPMILQRAAIGQVVMNLLINARHAVSGSAVRRVTVACACEGGRAVIRVSDTGCGIAPGNLARIFEPFFSTKSSTKSPTKSSTTSAGHARTGGDRPTGTGLGLSLCRSIVSAHGGEIAVDSMIGRGTNVSVYLPLRDASREQSRSAPAHADDRPAPSRNHGRAVLVVEDEPHLRSLLEDELCDAGWKVRTAADGIEALTILSGDDIDLVLLDLNMPGMGGDELLGHLRRRDRRPAIIAMSGQPFDVRVDRDVDVALAKPFDLDTILAQVALVMESHQWPEDRE